jgi:hypothetical protein
VWAKQLPGSMTSTNKVAVDHANNVVIGGTNGGGGCFYLGGGGTIQANGQTFTGCSDDGFVAKYDPAGNYLWSVVLAGGEAGVSGVALDGQNNVVATGYIQGTVSFGAQSYTTPFLQHALFVAKYDPSGNLMWVSVFGGANGNTSGAVHSVAVDASGQVFVLANLGGAVTFGNTTVGTAGGVVINGTSGGYITMALAKLDGATGNALWARGFTWASPIYGGFGGTAVAIDSSGNPVITGYVPPPFDLGGGVTSGGTFFARYSGVNGSYLWAKTLGNSCGVMACTNRGYDVAVDPSTGNVAFTGGVVGPVDFGGGTVSKSGAFVAAYGPTGNYLWATVIGGERDYGSGLAIDSSGDLALVGTMNNGYADLQLGAFLTELDTSGNYRWFTSIGAEATFVTTAFDSAGHIVVGGSYNPAGGALNVSGIVLTPPFGSYDYGLFAEYPR